MSMLKMLNDFFGVITRGQTYLNALYLLLAFPLGLFYFIFLVTGLSLGIGMLLLWIGVLILVGVFAAWYGMAAFERWLAIALLREQIPPMAREDLSGKTVWQKLAAMFKNPVTWKSLVYLMVRFPLGTFSFIVLVTFGSLSLALIAMPFYYQWTPADMMITFDGATFLPALIIDTLPEALIVALVGIFTGLISLHIFNGLAWVSGKFARVMLGSFSPVASTSVGPTGLSMAAAVASMEAAASVKPSASIEALASVESSGLVEPEGHESSYSEGDTPAVSAS